MTKTIVTCDKCKAEVVVNRYYDSKYKDIELTIGQYNKKRFEICPTCQKQLGMVKDEKEVQLQQAPTLAEKLLDVIAEMVAEQLQN